MRLANRERPESLERKVVKGSRGSLDRRGSRARLGSLVRRVSKGFRVRPG